MPQKIINYTMVNADIEIKEQTERSRLRHGLFKAVFSKGPKLGASHVLD